MNRYSKYFLNHLLWLDDGFCQYYLQNPTWISGDILDVQAVIFNHREDAERWILQCAAHDPSTTFRNLRVFLADHCLEPHSLHRMNDSQVAKAAAREICLELHQIVIEPRLGWAVQVDPATDEPILPVSVEPEPDVGSLMDELQADLNALVAEQRKNYDQWETRLAAMSEAESALLYSQSAGGGLYDSIVGDTVDTVVTVAKAFPGFLKGYFKTLKKIAQAPAKLAGVTAEAITTGSLNPFKREIDKIVMPIADTYEKAMEYKTMLTVLFNEPEVYSMLYDFADRYWEATHPMERTRMAASAVSDVVVTVILAIFTAGTAAAANMAAKTTKLAKVAKLLKKITYALRRMSPNRAVIAKGKNALKNIRKKKKPKIKNKHRVPEVVKPKHFDVVDDGPKMGYDNKDKDGPKTTKGAQAEELLSRARAAEPKVTKDLSDLAKATGGKQEGLDFRLKTKESLARKLETTNPENINDSLRYTITYPSENIGTGANKVMKQLEDAGYTKVKVKNTVTIQRNS
jgi:hypothetical protein